MAVSAARKSFTLICACAGCLMLSSCAMKKDVTELRRDIMLQNDIVESRLSTLELSVANIDSLVREQHRLTQSMRAMMGTQTQEQRENIDLMAARQDEINYQLRDLLQRLQAIQLYGGVETKSSTPTVSPHAAQQSSAQPQVNTPAKPVETAKVDANELYNAALDDVRNNRHQLAESRFLSFIMQYPKHKLAGNAQYWLGEAVYGQGKFELSITEFDKVLKRYKNSPKVPAAMLKIGFARLELGQTKEATATLNRLIKSYPKSEEAKLARERLNAPQ